MSEKKNRPKMGRPPLPVSERKLASVAFRPTPDIRRRLEEAATESGRSMSQEIQSRLERSLLIDDQMSFMYRDKGAAQLIEHLLNAKILIHACAQNNSWNALQEHEAFKTAIIEFLDNERPSVIGEGLGLAPQYTPLDDVQKEQAWAIGREMAQIIYEDHMEHLLGILSKHKRKGTKARKA